MLSDTWDKKPKLKGHKDLGIVFVKRHYYLIQKADSVHCFKLLGTHSECYRTLKER